MSSVSPRSSAISISSDTQKPEDRGGLRLIYLVQVLLVLALLVAPLALGAVQVWVWTSLTLVALMLIVLWAAGCAREGMLKIYWSPLYLPAAMFLVLGVVQFFGHLTADSIATRESLLKLMTGLLFLFLAGQLLATSPNNLWGTFGITVTVYAFALALFATLQFFASPRTIYGIIKTPSRSWPFGPYINHNHYAGLMEMLIPIAVTYVLSRPRDHPGRAVLGFAVLVPIVSLLLSGSRGGMISLLVEILIFGAILYWKAPIRGRRGVVTTGLLGASAAALLFFWVDPGDITKRLGTVLEVSSPTEASLGERIVVSLDSLRIFRDHPWTGTGLGSFETVYPQYASIPGDFLWEHAHNDYAEALAETGLVGGLLLLTALVMFFRLALPGLGDRLEHESGWLQMGAMLGCCGVLVHSFIDFNLHVPANAAWFAVCVACGASGLALSGPRESRAGLPSLEPSANACSERRLRHGDAIEFGKM